MTRELPAWWDYFRWKWKSFGKKSERFRIELQTERNSIKRAKLAAICATFSPDICTCQTLDMKVKSENVINYRTITREIDASFPIIIIQYVNSAQRRKVMMRKKKIVKKLCDLMLRAFKAWQHFCCFFREYFIIVCMSFSLSLFTALNMAKCSIFAATLNE